MGCIGPSFVQQFGSLYKFKIQIAIKFLNIPQFYTCQGEPRIPAFKTVFPLPQSRTIKPHLYSSVEIPTLPALQQHKPNKNSAAFKKYHHEVSEQKQISLKDKKLKSMVGGPGEKVNIVFVHAEVFSVM